jgi:hypothetical protein
MRAGANLRAVAFALYTLVCCAGVLAGLGIGLASGRYAFFVAVSVGFIITSVACSIRKLYSVRGGKFWLSLVPLTMLYMVYGMARASALLARGRRSARANPTDADAGGSRPNAAGKGVRGAANVQDYVPVASSLDETPPYKDKNEG